MFIFICVYVHIYIYMALTARPGRPSTGAMPPPARSRANC